MFAVTTSGLQGLRLSLPFRAPVVLGLVGWHAERRRRASERRKTITATPRLPTVARAANA
jgi:hypothetical protein